MEKSTFNDDLVVISKELERLYINVNPSKWKSFNYRNIYSWRYSIIGKHSPLHTSIAAFDYSIRNCHSLSDYIIITKPIHATRPFIRIEILIFQGQERPVFSSNLTISNYNFFPVFSSFYVFLKRFTLTTSHLQWVDFMMQRNDFAEERPEWLSVFSFIIYILRITYQKAMS